MKNKKTPNFMQLGLLTGVSILSLLLLTACSANTENVQTVEETDVQSEEMDMDESEENRDDNTILEESIETTETESLEETESVTEEIVSEDEEVAFDDDYDRESVLAAYKEALTQLYEEQIFPNGTEAEYYDDLSGNQFAVYDVDMDNRDELVIHYTTASMAGMAEHIYDYDEDTNSLYLELIEFPSLKFYDNQVLEAGWSHSQGYAGRFWIYTLYVYDSENDTYQDILHTDAWDKTLGEVDYYGNAFPEEADEDGDGIVYYILQPDEYYYNDDPIDWEAYETWHNETVGNEIEVPYMDLTPENIAAIE